MIHRECGVLKTTYEADMAFYPLPIARYTIVALAVLFFGVIPLTLHEYYLSIANLVWIAVIGALGLNILVGYTGQVSIGHGAFMSVGAYTAANFATRLDAPWPVNLLAGGLMAALVGAVVGIPSLRIKGLYLAIATLAGQFIIEWVINHSTWISGGVQSTIYVPTPTLFGFEINSEYRRFYMVLPVAVIAYVAAMNLVRSRVGRAFIAIRDRDVAAEIIGVDIFRYKLLAFAVSSFYAGAAGALWTYYLKIANYEHFTLATSVSYLAMIIIGGLGSVLGSVFGAIFITLLPIVLVYVVEGGAALFGFHYASIADFLANLRLIIFGALIILFLAIEPEGLFRMWGNVKRYFRLWPYSY
jgi:branched-chain amino acid transport system permease protein